MIEYERLMPDVLQAIYNEGVEESSFNKNRALYAIRKSYETFLRRSRVLRRTYSLYGQAGVHEYPLFKKDGEVINKIYSVVVDGCCYEKGDLCSCNCCGNKYSYGNGVLCLCSAPECDGAEIEVCAAVHPVSGDCKMDEFVYEHYKDAIASGAIHNLLAKKISAAYQVEFDEGVSEARSQAAAMWAEPKKGRRAVWVRR